MGGGGNVETSCGLPGAKAVLVGAGGGGGLSLRGGGASYDIQAMLPYLLASRTIPSSPRSSLNGALKEPALETYDTPWLTDEYEKSRTLPPAAPTVTTNRHVPSYCRTSTVRRALSASASRSLDQILYGLCGSVLSYTSYCPYGCTTMKRVSCREYRRPHGRGPSRGPEPRGPLLRLHPGGTGGPSCMHPMLVFVATVALQASVVYWHATAG